MTLTVLYGNSLDVLATLPERSVQCCITSPPYYALRKYDVPDVEWPAVEYAPMPGLPPITVEPWVGQLGLEPTPEAFIGHLVLIWRHVWRVLRDDGVCFLNIADSYAGGKVGNTNGGTSSGLKKDGRNEASRQRTNVNFAEDMQAMAFTKRLPAGLKPKDLMLIPARLALALQADGWTVRQDIIWAKGRDGDIEDVGPGNVMPESVTDRCTKAHEYVWLLSKGPRYYWDGEAIKEIGVKPPGANGNFGNKDADARMRSHLRGNMRPGVEYLTNGTRNARSVWLINTAGTSEAHYATWPERLVERCVLAGSSPRACEICNAPWERVLERGELIATHDRGNQGYNLKKNGGGGYVMASNLARDGVKPGMAYEQTTTGWRSTCAHDCAGTGRSVVLDPFFGSGTTGKVAIRHGRACVGIDLSSEYLKIANRRTDGVQTSLVSLID